MRERLEVVGYGSTHEGVYEDARKIAEQYFGDRPHHLEEDPRRPTLVQVHERSVTGDVVIFTAHIYFVAD